jgi:hypothetical protein
VRWDSDLNRPGATGQRDRVGVRCLIPPGIANECGTCQEVDYRHRTRRLMAVPVMGAGICDLGFSGDVLLFHGDPSYAVTLRPSAHVYEGPRAIQRDSSFFWRAPRVPEVKRSAIHSARCAGFASTA